jgi:hypothetical protein
MVYSFSPFDDPQYYGLPPYRFSTELMQGLFKRPPPGIYIISGHYVARMGAVDPAWRSYQPVDRIGKSLLVYRF